MSDLEYRIAKLEAKPGDVLVFKFDQLLTYDAVRHFQQSLKSVLPDGVRALILERDCNLSVLTAEEIAKRSAA